MQFKKAAMTQIAQSGIRHGGKTVVSNEKNIAKAIQSNQRAKSEPAVFTGIICFYLTSYVRDIYFCTTRFALGDHKKQWLEPTVSPQSPPLKHSKKRQISPLPISEKNSSCCPQNNRHANCYELINPRTKHCAPMCRIALGVAFQRSTFLREK